MGRRPKDPNAPRRKSYYVKVADRPQEPNKPWNPAPAKDIPTVSMFLECENGHVSYRHELEKAPCKICGSASSATG